MANLIRVDWNTCWVCKHQNLSQALICAICTAEIPPSKIGLKKLTYCIYSFGSRATKFCCVKLNAALLDDAVGALQLQHDTPVVIRAGTNQMQAILIKDTNGEIRLSIEGVPDSVATVPPPAGSNKIAEFRAASRHILAADPDQTPGKTLPFQP
ncbi:uncharacterized protein K460DRAFT_408355 [Cucurbitaria berberidis CBS 394.84]|uniref:Uncharacterized protein n=1 Tax=Cucurbitaria berberidis CBS 394.84 TaxID=1168544 RepID=A0A9P4L7F1_9PLEO|nr:uncharacterized protein K460DRAFT_408355 [Cucurbitaria berberidis CBS 394.84]KAF1844043.1 hypothetical protein K460DRAFT_408355 [Cucurbitaria berberidis CBS 394.84]